MWVVVVCLFGWLVCIVLRNDLYDLLVGSTEVDDNGRPVRDKLQCREDAGGSILVPDAVVRHVKTLVRVASLCLVVSRNIVAFSWSFAGC